MPEDYCEVLAKSRTHHWIDKFRKTIKITLDTTDVKWMLKAQKIGMITGNFSDLFDDELNHMLTKYAYLNLFDHNMPYFVRTDETSLKYGMHGVGPYYDFKSIIESSVSSIHGHSPLSDDTTYYLSEWININQDKEFRVFVYKNKITAISQQSITKSNLLLLNLNDNDRNLLINKWINIICLYFQDIIMQRIDHVNSYAIDFAILENDEPYFIELSSFGKEYAAGSALYHWIIDEDILYGKTNEIYFRYAI
jgi:hypothetical protein